MISHRKPLKRRTPLKRGPGPKRSGSLKRKSWPRRRRPKPRRDAEPEYLDWIRRQCCAARDFGPCGGRIEAHHAGKNPGVSLKAPDSSCIPLCSYHHAALGSFYGPFRQWSGERARRWQDDQIGETRSRYLAQEGRL